MTGQIVATSLSTIIPLNVGVVRAATRKHCASCGKRRVAHAIAITLGPVQHLGPWLCRACADAPA